MFRAYCLRLTLVAGCLVFMILAGQSLCGAPVYDIEMLGLTDSLHTRTDGRRDSTPQYVNESGQIAGWAARYDGSSAKGSSSWIFDNDAVTRIGLVDAEHTRNDNYQFSNANALSAAGQVMGASTRYNGSAEAGQSTWFYDSGVTMRIGFIDGVHTSSAGLRYSFPQAINDVGQVVGNSYRYSGTATSGQSAWMYDHGITTRLGFTDAAHTRGDGYQFSGVSRLNAAGQAVGFSWRNVGKSAWLYDDGVTTRLGLIDAAYPDNDSSDASRINAAGQVVGSSYYSNAGSVYYGDAPWLYSGGVTTRLGFTSAAFTRDDGYRSSQAFYLNEAGYVTGRSQQYLGSTFIGDAMWLYDGATTIQIGLTDAEHTGSNGRLGGQPVALNEAGQVIGISSRFNGVDNSNGQSAWIYSNGHTTRLGYSDAAHTRSDIGYQDSYLTALNEAGQVIGTSARYSGVASMGRSGWFYDDDLDQLFSLNFSVRSDGYCFTSPAYVGDDGTVLGSYELFGAAGQDLGERAFLWTMTDGMKDLGALVDGGLTANGWQSLSRASFMGSQGEILGSGHPTSYPGGNVAFLMTPVPEPATWILLLGGALSFAVAFRRSRTRFDR
jgi:hypothetical protein